MQIRRGISRAPPTCVGVNGAEHLGGGVFLSRRIRLLLCLKPLINAYGHDCCCSGELVHVVRVACGGPGVRHRTFRISRQHAAGGKRCEARDGSVEEDKTCNSQPCVVNCEGAFTRWSQCTRECGPGGTSSRRFIVSRREAGGGEVCSHAPESLETRPCNDKPCPADCVGEWSRWSECSQTCGAGGVKKRTFAVRGTVCFRCSFSPLIFYPTQHGGMEGIRLLPSLSMTPSLSLSLSRIYSFSHPS